MTIEDVRAPHPSRLRPSRPQRGVLERSPAAAYLWACTLDVAVRKPGNVSLAAPGHGMEAGQFLASACVSAPPLFDPALGVGARLEAAVRATRAAAGCNTNLGILLLCAPVARAFETLALQPERSPARLRTALGGALDALDLADACAAYRAIATANPGGLGAAPEQDVSAEPDVGLREAMRLAAHRDLIARQYANGYAEVFALGLAAFARQPGRGQGDGLSGSPGAAAEPEPLAQRVQRVYLAWLANHPDSHIARKHGEAAARAVSAEAAVWRDRLAAEPAAAAGEAFAAWDDALKARGLNPGTSADLTVCTLFIAALLEPELVAVAADETHRAALERCLLTITVSPLPAPSAADARMHSSSTQP